MPIQKRCESVGFCIRYGGSVYNDQFEILLNGKNIAVMGDGMLRPTARTHTRAHTQICDGAGIARGALLLGRCTTAVPCALLCKAARLSWRRVRSRLRSGVRRVMGESALRPACCRACAALIVRSCSSARPALAGFAHNASGWGWACRVDVDVDQLARTEHVGSDWLESRLC